MRGAPGQGRPAEYSADSTPPSTTSNGRSCPRGSEDAEVIRTSQWAEIRHLDLVAEVAKKDVARPLVSDLKTVHRAVDRPTPPVRVSVPRLSSLDPTADFAELLESERRDASYLPGGTGALLVLLLELSTGWCRSVSRTLQPVFVRVDEVGRAEAVDNEALTWPNAPLHPSTKYFPRQFVSDQYSRGSATVTERWPQSLGFLERTLAAVAHEKEIAEFSAGLAREARAVENLVLARPAEPHEAVADYGVVRRLNARDVDPYEQTTNLIGLTITYYAADRSVPLRE